MSPKEHTYLTESLREMRELCDDPEDSPGKAAEVRRLLGIVSGGLVTYAEELLSAMADAHARTSDGRGPMPGRTPCSTTSGRVATGVTEAHRNSTTDAKLLDHQPGFVTKREIARELGFSVRHIDNLLQQGCPYIKFSARCVRFDVAEVLVWCKDKFAVRRRGRCKST
jgi:hypothetical protein